MAWSRGYRPRVLKNEKYQQNNYVDFALNTTYHIDVVLFNFESTGSHFFFAMPTTVMTSTQDLKKIEYEYRSFCYCNKVFCRPISKSTCRRTGSLRGWTKRVEQTMIIYLFPSVGALIYETSFHERKKAFPHLRLRYRYNFTKNYMRSSEG